VNTPGRFLRAAVVPAVQTPVVLMPVVAKKRSRSTKREDILSQAAAQGYSCLKTLSLIKSFAKSIATRLSPRKGYNVYQTAEYTIENFPRQVAEQIFPTALLKGDPTSTRAAWSADTMSDLYEMLKPILSQAGMSCVGVTRALQSKSESVVRVVATMLQGAEFVWCCRGGVDKLLVKFMFVLADEMGELHGPKSADRIEIALSNEVERALRKQIVTDVKEMARQSYQLAPGFWQQIGQPLQAQVAEAQILNLEQRTSTKRKRADVFEVDSIRGEDVKTKRVLVRWANYHPSHEAWRCTARNPYLPQSAQLLRIFGLGNCHDDKSGTMRLMGENLTIINKLITADEPTSYQLEDNCVVGDTKKMKQNHKTKS